ncbi:MAG: hypothetical protein WHV67_01970 [Thermoanaerobaculia bacterium]
MALLALLFYLGCSSKEEKILKARASFKIKLLSFQRVEKGTALDFLVYNGWGNYFKGITVEIWVMKEDKVKEKREVFIPTETLRPFYEEQVTVILEGLQLEEEEGLALMEIPNPSPEQKRRFKEFQETK